jgi:hypothetical protein
MKPGGSYRKYAINESIINNGVSWRRNGEISAMKMKASMAKKSGETGANKMKHHGVMKWRQRNIENISMGVNYQLKHQRNIEKRKPESNRKAEKYQPVMKAKWRKWRHRKLGVMHQWHQ